jgi:hypothetical protein
MEPFLELSRGWWLATDGQGQPHLVLRGSSASTPVRSGDEIIREKAAEYGWVAKVDAWMEQHGHSGTLECEAATLAQIRWGDTLSYLKD